MLAEAGCTTPQIAAITGHSLKTVSSILDRYLARTRVLASKAVAWFENASSTDFANRLQTKAPQLAEKDAKSWKWNGAPEEIRTPDPQIRSLVLYPAELRARNGSCLDVS